MKHSTPYVYLLKDLETGKRYFGCRFAVGCDPSDLGVSYFTSSSTVAPLFSADPARFEKKILAVGSTDYVIELEKKLIDEHCAVLSDEFYNRTSGRAVHPDDRLAGAFKEHAKRSPELYASIAAKMHSKTTADQRRAAAKKAYELLTPEQQRAKMQMMRDSKTEEGKAKSLLAMREAATFEQLSAAGKKGGLLGGKKGCAVTNSQRWKCVECGMVSLPGPLGKHQSRSSHSGKERVL
jgi:hypothetical protein